MIRSSLAALALAILTFALLPAPPAAAVYPGAKGLLALSNTAYAPPDPAEVNRFDGVRTVRYSPDGTMVAGVASVGGDFYKTSIWVANADGTGARQLVPPGAGRSDTDRDPTWAADGKSLVFARQRQRGDLIYSALMRVDVETGALSAIVPLGRLQFRMPELSPDGSRIIARVGEEDGWWLRFVNPETGGSRRISGTQYYHMGRFSPDGTKIVTAQGYMGPEVDEPWVRVLDAANPARRIMNVRTEGLDAYTTAFATFTPDGSAITWGDCRPGCGVWSKALPTQDVPNAPPTQDIALDWAGVDTEVDWQPVLGAASITAGPAGETRGGDATFTFAAPSSDGRFECRLVELGTWATCTSPKVYTGLADGLHTFQVRFVQEGDTDPEDNAVASRDWVSDATPPVAMLDQAPSGTVEAREATFAFHSSEPDGAAFRCSVDGGPEADCASPVRLTSFADGDHTFTVRAIDAVGNEQREPTRASWTVKPPPASGGDGGGGTGSGGGGTQSGGGSGPDTRPPAQGCSSGTVTAGVITAIARGGCFRKRKDDDHDVFVTTGDITLNGVQIMPAAGTSIVIDPRLNDVDVKWTGPVTMGFDEFTWTIPFAMRLPIGKANTTAKFVLPAFEKLQDKLKVAGLKIAFAPQFEMTGDDGGATKVGLKIALPSAFSGIKSDGDVDDEKAGGLSFEFAFTASNEKGTRFTIKSQIDRAWLWGKAKLTDVSIGLDTGPPLAFEAAGSLTLNPERMPRGVSKEHQLTAAIAFTKEEGQWPNIDKVAIGAGKIGKQLAYGFFLQRFGGEFKACGGKDGGAGTITANGGISLGPRFELKPVFEGEALALDGKIAVGLCKEPQLEFSGEGKIVDVKVGNAGLKFPFDGYPTLTGELDMSIGGYGYLAKIENSWFALEADKFNVQGNAELRLPGLLGGLASGKSETVLSSTGLAACFGRPDYRIGFGKRWGGDLDHFAGACDIGPYTARARAAQAGATQTFSVAPKTKVKLVALTGNGAPPKATLTGPQGRTVAVPSGPEVLERPDAMVVQDPVAATTYIALIDPPAGEWSVAPLPAGPAPTGLRTAENLPPVAISARSRRAKRGRRALAWKLPAISGQEVTFTEIGAGTTRVITTTRKARGRIGYAPQPGRGGPRRVEATVMQNGLPRATEVVARYRVRPLRIHRPGRARLRGAAVTWRQRGTAESWSVLLRSADGRTASLETRRPRALVPRGWPTRRITVVTTAIGPGGEAGPLRRTVLKRRR